jgi:hypothetical protein
VSRPPAGPVHAATVGSKQLFLMEKMCLQNVTYCAVICCVAAGLAL